MTTRGELVIQRLFLDILHGAKGSEGKLPSAASLAGEYSISTASVREALKVLESIGIVSMEQGRGILVERQDQIVAELLDARIALETRNAREAAAGRGERDIERINAVRARLEQAFEAKHVELYSNADYDLHFLVAEHGHNRILKSTLENIRTVLYSQQLEVNRIPEVLARSHADHLLLLDEIVTGRPEAAARAMHEHLTHVRETWIRLLAQSTR